VSDPVRIRTDFPYEVRVVEHVWIPTSDGTRLAARLWLPVGAEESPVPAVLCYLPYRKNDGVAAGDHQEMTYYAGHGYAGVRVDIRGTGDSDGIIEDEYTEQELADGVEVIAWIAEQPWCNGSVGMTGASWGGFNSLQIAARRPPALKAIVTFYSTDDRYADDVHYKGGCVLGLDMLHWATCMLAFNAKPPDPAHVGEGWRDQWLDRLERTPPFIEAWLSHQRRDAYWRHGSVCEDYAAIECPVYAIGGWADGYTDAVLRLLSGLSVPRKGLIGPWGHNDPVHGAPGPAMGSLTETVRWWDRWLKGVENGIEDEPMLTVWLQDWVEPSPSLAFRPGRWAAEEEWPSPRIEPRAFPLGSGALLSADGGDSAPVGAEPARPVEIAGSLLHGLDSGAWCADGRSADLPSDQRAEDGRSLCFDSAPVEEAIEILGFPVAELELTVDRPLALVALRLCDVAPTGESLLVSRAVLNLTHRNGHDRVEPMTPGEPVRVRVRLDSAAHSFRAGHVVRLAVSPTYWPFAWPSPEPVTLTLFPGASRLELPVRPPRPEDESISLPEPEEPPPYASETLRQDTPGRRVVHDLATGRSELRFDWDLGGLVRYEASGIEHEDTSSVTYAIVAGDPLSARVACQGGFVVRRGDWDTSGRVTGEMTSTTTHFHVTTSLEAHERNVRIWAKSWAFAIPRDGV
jgi:putative CocE/NonD family hydrolase